MVRSFFVGPRSPGKLRLTLSVFFVLALAGAAWQFLRPAPKLNVLVITLDTTRADRLGCYGHQAASTPALDRLAERSVLFEQAYAPVPLTLPSHASLFTGLYPPEHGLRVNSQGALPAGLPTLAMELQSAGYETGAFIAAAIVLEKKYGLARGFQTYDDDDQAGAVEGLEGHYRYRPAQVVIDRALAWLQPRARKPFCCWIHLYDPHAPYLAHTERFGSQFDGRPYDAELAYVDAELKRVFAALETWGVADRTVIVVVGDHGECLDEHGERAHGLTVYDAALKVPLIVHAPGTGRPGHRVPEPVSLVDVCPTVLECLGRRPPRGLSGRSLRTALRGEPLEETPVYAETDEPYHEARCSPLRALITSQWKYIRSPIAELYDLQQDPRELRNLAADHATQLQAQERQLAAWEQRLQQRVAENVSLTDQERRALNSLGYSAHSEAVTPDDESRTRDVKSLLPLFAQLKDADALMDLGKNDLAEPILRKIVAADDRYFTAHGSLGRCLLKLDRTQEAIVAFRRCLDAQPGDDRIRTMLGVALYLTGDFAAAAQECEIALRTNAELIEARYNLALSLEKLGRIDEALSHYELCLDQMPHFAPARQRIEELQPHD